MAIDYDSGSGLFDKLGPVVSMVNAIEAWQTTNSSGNLEGDMTTLEGKLEEAKDYDRLAKQLLLSKWANYKTTLDNMKVRYTELTRLLMASEMCIQETMSSASLPDLLNYLKFAMIRDDRSVPDNTITNLAGTLDGVVTTVCLQASIYGTDQPTDTDSQVLGQIYADTLHVEVTDVTTPGREKVRVFGTNPLSSNNPGHPKYEYSGVILSSYDIREYNKNNLLKNGDLTQVDAQGRLTNWTASIGAWGGVFTIGVGTDGYAISPQVLNIGFSTEAKLTQELPRTLFKPNTKYLMVFAYNLPDGAASTDGDLEYGVDISSSTNGTFDISLGVDLRAVYFLFNTQDQVTNCTAYLQRTGATQGIVQLLGIAIYEMSLTTSGWMCILNTPDIDLPNIVRPTALGIPVDQIPFIYTNDHGGKFMTYFARYMNFLLPIRSGASEISDALVP